jgi:predicted PurR-regulated permease PerM
MQIAMRPISAPNDAAPDVGSHNLGVDAADRPKSRPVRDTLDAIERVVGSMTLVPWLLAIGALWWGQAVIIPIAVSVLVSYALESPVEFLEGWRVPRAIGVPLVLVALIGGLGFTAYELRGEAQRFVSRLPDAAHKVAQVINHRKTDASGSVGKLQAAASELERAASPNRQSPGDNVASVRVEEPTFRWSDWLWQGSHGAIEVGAQLFAMFCLLYYLMVSGDLFKRKLLRIVGPSMSAKKTTVDILKDIDRQIAQFLWARVAISVAVGVGMWFAFRLLGLEDAGVWGVLSGLLFTVPVAGPLLVIVGAGLAGFVQFGTSGMTAAAAGVASIIAALEGYVLTPLLMSRVGEMNAVAVFISLMFWGWIWGIWGLLLAVPITAAIKAVCERVEDLEPFAELLRA